MAVRALIHMPRQARVGDVFEVRALVQHPMETGHRVDAGGQAVPRDLIRRFECQFEGEPVCTIELHAAVAANPLLAFQVRASRSGRFVFSWSGDNGLAHREVVTLQVA